MLSYWEKNTFLPLFDLLVVGAGLTGLSAALAFKQERPEARVLVLERGILPAGASVKNAGFACFGSPSELLDDLAYRSEEEVFGLVEQRLRGLSGLRQMLGDQAIGYAETGAHELFCKPENPFGREDQNAWEHCMNKLPFLNAALRQITNCKQTFEPLSKMPKHWDMTEAIGLIKIHKEGQLDTGRMMHSLLQMAREKGVLIYGGAEVLRHEEEEQEVKLPTRGGLLFRGRQVLLAVNGFVGALLDLPDIQAARNQVLVATSTETLPWQGNFHHQKGYFYFRKVGKRHILLGGGRHLRGEQEMTAEQTTTPEVQTMLENYLKKVVAPGASLKITHRWSGILGVGSAKHPIIKSIGKRTCIAVRLGGMGVALGAETGRQAAQMLLRMC